jgi:hypothetical protein
VLEGVRAKLVGGKPAADSEHFYTCPACGEAVDKRDLAAVLHHEQPVHAAMRGAPAPST